MNRNNILYGSNNYEYSYAYYLVWLVICIIVSELIQ